ncbi:single-stranded DNA-binding protein [Candidatus Aminicenantes bacterium AH-873-B07]|jgi:single-strand DNA-binding protein|nr:single-stranded DNA-binding protein [Candidatus Aminicenantes bacterium AH-873-B07]
MKDINSLNRVFLIGHLGGEPEVRYIAQGERAVARFSLATNEVYFDQAANENKKRTEWHRIVAWGKLAEFCEKYLTKGKQIYIEGKLRTRTWEDKSGIKRSTTEIEAQSIVLLGKKEEMEEESPSPEEIEEKVEGEEVTPPDEEEVPF